MIASMFNPFYTTGLFLCPLKTSENLWFSGVSGVIEKSSGMTWVHVESWKMTMLTSIVILNFEVISTRDPKVTGISGKNDILL